MTAQPPVTVYSKNNCVQCDATKNWLVREKVAFHEINLEDDPSALVQVKEMGFLQAPVVVPPFSDGGWSPWAGFRPDKLEALKKAL